MLGGENVAGTPLDFTQFAWALSTDKHSTWRMSPIKVKTFISLVVHDSSY